MADISSMSDQEVLARTALGENGGGGTPGMTSVLNVIVNRANNPGWWGTTPREVCLKPKQFDCWSPGTNDYTITVNTPLTDPTLTEAMNLASQALSGSLVDITSDSCYYFAKSMPEWPYWAVGQTPAADIAGQLFFNTVNT